MELRRSTRLDLPDYLFDRVEFLRRSLGLRDPGDVFEAAVIYFDRAVCASLDHGRVVINHRDGSKERLDPCAIQKDEKSEE